MMASTGKPEAVCVAVWLGVCVSVRVSVGVWLCDWLGVAEPLGVPVPLGLCDCVGVGEQIRLTTEARRAGKVADGAHVAPESVLSHAPRGLARPGAGAPPAPAAPQYTGAEAETTIA